MFANKALTQFVLGIIGAVIVFQFTPVYTDEKVDLAQIAEFQISAYT